MVTFDTRRDRTDKAEAGGLMGFSFLFDKLVTTRGRQLDLNRLESLIRSLKLNKKPQKTLKASCEAIDFPPQHSGLK
jgi:hypothetical protein